jgi:mono/diheme cytochrome c family protein
MGMITRIILRSLIAIVGVVAAAVGLLMLALQLGWARRHDAPEPQLHATTDPDVVARGRYLVYGPAACAYCHRPKTDWPALARGEMPPLSGGHEFPLPFGAIFSSNLTADRDTGIGAASDGTIARVLRYGVRRDGRAAVPIMEFQNLSDEDLVAVLSFLRTQPSVHQQPPPQSLDVLRETVAWRADDAAGADEAAAAREPLRGDRRAGRYLANDVAACVSCHTDRQSGALVGPRFAGGQHMDFAGDTTRVLVPPNLTPDAATGRIASWSENVFVARFHTGSSSIPETILPWGAYARMTDDDLRAIYRYLRSLPPTRRDTGPSVQHRRMGAEAHGRMGCAKPAAT